MNWRNRQNRFGSINDFAAFVLSDTAPTEDNLKRVAAEVSATLTGLGYDSIDLFAVDDLHMMTFEIQDSEVIVGLSQEEPAVWSLHVQMLDPGLFGGTRDRRLAIVDRLNRHLHDALTARADLKGIEWFQERKVMPKQGTARPME